MKESSTAIFFGSTTVGREPWFTRLCSIRLNKCPGGQGAPMNEEATLWPSRAVPPDAGLVCSQILFDESPWRLASCDSRLWSRSTKNFASALESSFTSMLPFEFPPTSLLLAISSIIPVFAQKFLSSNECKSKTDTIFAVIHTKSVATSKMTGPLAESFLPRTSFSRAPPSLLLSGHGNPYLQHLAQHRVRVHLPSTFGCHCVVWGNPVSAPTCFRAPSGLWEVLSWWHLIARCSLQFDHFATEIFLDSRDTPHHWLFCVRCLQVESANLEDRDVLFLLAPVWVPDLLTVSLDLVKSAMTQDKLSTLSCCPWCEM